MSATDYDVIYLQPHDLRAWIGGVDDADAVVLDLESAALALAAFHDLRAHGKLAPPSSCPATSQVGSAQRCSTCPAAEVLPLPINRIVRIAALETCSASGSATELTGVHAFGRTGSTE